MIFLELLNKIELQDDDFAVINCLKGYVTYVSDTAQ